MIALILWAYVRVTTGGFGQSKITQMEIRVPLQLKGDTSLITFERSHDTIAVSLRGDSRIVENLDERMVSAFVVMDDVQAGTHYPEVQAVAPAGVQVLGSNPSSVTLRLSAPMVKEVPLAVNIAGHAKKGYYVGEPSLSNKTIRIEGPEALVAQVRQVSVRVPLEGREKGFSLQAFSLIAVNENGTEVMGSGNSISFSPREVTVSVPIERTETMLNLPVALDKVKIAQVSGYSIKTEIVPELVLVGSRLPEGVEPPSNLSTESISFPASTKVQERVVKLTPVEGLEFKNTKTVVVRLTPTKIAKPTPKPSPTP